MAEIQCAGCWCRYGVMVDGERGNRPNIMAQEDLLKHTVS